MKRRQISPERKTSYYVGMLLTVVGFVTFGSVFVTAVTGFGDFTGFQSQVTSSMVRALLGMGMVIAGRALMKVGARGLAGSGALLDPEKAREDMEPWARMAGGVLRDALDEADVDLKGGAAKRLADAAPAMPFDEKLRRLHKLYEEGLISAEEYAREKQEILDSN